MYYVDKDDLEQANNLKHATNLVDAHEWRDKFAILPRSLDIYGWVWLTWYQEHKAYFGTFGCYTLYRRPMPNMPAVQVADWCRDGGYD